VLKEAVSLIPGVVWLLAVAVSIDGFSAGLSCGLRKLVIPISSLLVICCSSAAAVGISMLLGSGVAQLIPVQYVAAFGGGVLILMGLYVTVQNITESSLNPDPAEPSQVRTRPKSLSGLIHRPEDADLDHSGTLSMKEALLLGAALAADAFGAGFGAAMIGSPLLVTVLAVGLVKLILVPSGVLIGRLMADGFALKYPGLVGGVLLIFVGVLTFLSER
jgi:putative sporulation protein YtaF